MKFFTSDPHYWHANILLYTKRPWTTLSEMHEGLIRNYNAKVGPEDECYFLGDTMMGGKKDMPWRMEHIFTRLNGKKYLIRGNHDKHCREDWFKKHFEWVDNYHELWATKSTAFVLCHYPLYSWHGMARKAINLHGHCHGNVDRANLATRRIDVGVDGMYSNHSPLSMDEILNIMKDRQVQYVDHHMKGDME